MKAVKLFANEARVAAVFAHIAPNHTPHFEQPAEISVVLRVVPSFVLVVEAFQRNPLTLPRASFAYRAYFKPLTVHF